MLHRRAMLGLLCLLASGCAGYHMGTRSLYAPDITTVYVPIFESESLRRNLGERLTEAVIKEIELKTPYKVVGNADDADSILSGRITGDRKNVLVEAPSDDPREIEFGLAVEVNWLNRRGEMIRDPRVVQLPGALTTLQETGTFVPEGGQSLVTGQQEAINDLATRIVNMMEIPW